jgi:hypothetical protein
VDSSDDGAVEWRHSKQGTHPSLLLVFRCEIFSRINKRWTRGSPTLNSASSANAAQLLLQRCRFNEAPRKVVLAKSSNLDILQNLTGSVPELRALLSHQFSQACRFPAGESAHGSGHKTRQTSLHFLSFAFTIFRSRSVVPNHSLRFSQVAPIHLSQHSVSYQSVNDREDSTATFLHLSEYRKPEVSFLVSFGPPHPNPSRYCKEHQVSYYSRCKIEIKPKQPILPDSSSNPNRIALSTTLEA